MADGAKIWVRATARGQGPDTLWRDAGSSPFRVTENQFSKAWMEKLTDEESGALNEAEAAARANRKMTPEEMEARILELEAMVEAPEPLTPESIASMKKADLVDLLAAHDADVSGTVEVLRERALSTIFINT